MELLKENKTVFVIGVIILALLIFYGINTGNDSGNVLLTSSSPNVSKEVNDRELLQLLIDMRSINLEGYIFEDPTYLSLQDFSRSIVPEPVGRQDPFAPLPKTEVTISGGDDLSDQALLR